MGDVTLMLMLLRGLSGMFCHMVSNLKMQCPFLTLEEVRTKLLLEEIDINNAAIEAPPMAAPSFIAVPNATLRTLLVVAPAATALAPVEVLPPPITPTTVMVMGAPPWLSLATFTTIT